MRALNTIGRPIVTSEATITGSASGVPADLGVLFPFGRGEMSVASSGRVAGAAHQIASITRSYKTVLLSDGTSIAFSSVRADEPQLAGV